MRRLRLLALVGLAALAATGCSDEGDTVTAATVTAVPATTALPTTASPTTTGTSITTTTSSPPSTTRVPDTDLPGEEFDFGYSEGTILSVFGVRHDDVLNVRARPGLAGDVIATLDPLEAGFTATGRHRLLPTTVWSELVVDGSTTGWVNRTFIAVEGVTTDETASIATLFDGEMPAAETLSALGFVVAESLAFGDPVRIEMSAAPTVGDLGGVTYDLAGIADDSVAGFRLRVFAIERNGSWELRNLESMTMCSRGGTPGGLCL